MHGFFLKDYTQQLYDRVPWTAAGVESAASELSEHWRNKLNNMQSGGKKPDTAGLIRALKKAKGGSGLDGWTANDVHLFARSEAIVESLQDQYLLWEDAGIAPTVLKQTKISFIPKDASSGPLPAKRYRPISVYSVLWRCWSSMWCDSDLLFKMRACFVDSMANYSGYGAESQSASAALLFHERECRSA